MTDNRRYRAQPVQAPGRVQDAAKAMSFNTSSGYRRGYVPDSSGYTGFPPASSAPYATPQYSQPNSPRGPRGVSAGNGRQKKPGGKKTLLIAVAVIGLIAAGFGLYSGGNYLINVKPVEDNIRNTVAYYHDYFSPGVSVDGIALDGMTVEQAQNMVQSQIQQKYLDWHVDLTYQGVTKSISAADLGIEADISGALNSAWEIGHNYTGSRTDQEMYDEIIRASNEKIDFYSIKSTGDLSRIDAIIDTISKALYSAPQNAQMIRFDPYDTSLSDPFIYQDEIYGQRVNADERR